MTQTHWHGMMSALQEEASKVVLLGPLLSLTASLTLSDPLQIVFPLTLNPLFLTVTSSPEMPIPPCTC